MKVLGISAFYHDSAAALIIDGEIIAAAQEERFTRVKHDPRFPINAINYCMQEAFIDAEDLDAVVYYDNPLLTWDRIVKNSLGSDLQNTEQFKLATEAILGTKVWLKDHVMKALGGFGKTGKLLVSEHHFSHAASAFYPSPFASAAILTMDGVGEWATTTVGYGNDNEIHIQKQISYPHSLGLLYSAFTYYCGFKVNSGEYKLMGLAPYGQPIYYDLIMDHLVDVKSDGSYRLNMEYFGYHERDIMISEAFRSLFGEKERAPESQISIKQMNIAASIQKVTEEIVLKTCRSLRSESGEKNLVLSGGVALNCVANGKILQEGIFDNIWIQPASGDAGGALGAALHVYHNYLGQPRVLNNDGSDQMKGGYLGPQYNNHEIEDFLKKNDLTYHVLDKPERSKVIAKALSDGLVVGYMAGRMEFGPRSLGGRSILGDARSPKMQSQINLKIKYRESFRPFAPSVLEEKAGEYFDLNASSPYMLLVAPVQENRRLAFDLDAIQKVEMIDMIHLINEPRSDVPAVTHVDYSARVQTVNKNQNPHFHDVISAFEELTGCAVVVNTSFNVRGEPIVNTPEDAYRCFMRTEMDVLVIENYILYKHEQESVQEDTDWRNEYALD
jgi:carbamoyltransferase